MFTFAKKVRIRLLLYECGFKVPGMGDNQPMPDFGGQRSRNLGSRASRRASPKRLKPNTVNAIARPGKIAIQGAVEAYSSAPPCSISPHAGVGSWTPRPR